MRPSRVAGLALAVGVVGGGCTSVRVAQKDGCWVRRTERWLQGATEEVGPCAPPQPRWSDDRLTRLIQECVVRADYRWQARALDAWNQGRALPEHASEETVLRQCLGEPTRAVLAENEALRGRAEASERRLAELRGDRDALRVSEERAREELVGSYARMNDKMTDYLGGAANKAQAPATATATATSDSEGAARTEAAHDARASLAAGPPPGAPAAVAAVAAEAPAAAPRPQARQARAARPRPPPEAVACVPAAGTCAPGAAAPAAARERTEAVWAPVLIEAPASEGPVAPR